MKEVPGYLLLAAAALIGIGTYLGGWAITSGHILLTFGGVGFLVVEGPRLRKSGMIRSSTWCLLALLILYGISIGIFWDEYDQPVKIVKKLRYILLPLGILFFGSIYHFYSDRANLISRVLFVCVSVAIVAATLSGLIAYFTGYNPLRFEVQEQGKRAGGINGMVMTYAYSIGLALLFFLGSACNEGGVLNLFGSRRRRFFQACLWFVIVLGTVGLFFSGTRGAVLGLIIGGLIYVLCAKKWKILVLASVCGFLVIGYSLSLKSRFVAIEETSDSNFSSHYERFSQWRAASLVFLDNPILGVGYRRFEPNSVAYKKKFNLPKDHIVKTDGQSFKTWSGYHAHSNYLESFASTGVPGGLLFIGFCGFWAMEVWRSRLGRTLFFPTIVALIISGFFENTFFDGEVVTMIMLLYVSSQFVLDSESSGQPADLTV